MADEKKPDPRCWLYKGGDSKLFEGKDAIAKAKKDGWKDKPAKG